MRRALRFLVAVALGLPAAASAAPTPQTRPVVSPSDDRLRTGFDGLPDADRRAIQDALLWTGDFAGIVSGAFGPRTREALMSFARRSGLAPDAVLDANNRDRLLNAGAKARADVGFSAVNDKAAGVAVSLPTKLLPRRSPAEGGTHYASPDGAIVADTLSRPAGPGGLPEVFDRMSGGSGARKVTYKLLRPDFFVVVGEIGERKFYSRFALGTSEGRPMIRGITLAYPKTEAGRMDAVSLAAAGSFDPFPSSAPPAGSGGPAGTAAPPTPPVKPPPPPATFALTAIKVQAGAALTHLPKQPCLDPSLGGSPVMLRKKDDASGLAIFDGLRVPAQGAAPIFAAEPATGRTPLVVLFAREPEGLDMAPAALHASGDPSSDTFSVSAGIQGRAEGMPLVDTQGRLVGLVTEPRRVSASVAGTRLQNDYPVIASARLRLFLKETGMDPATSGEAPAASLGAVAAFWRPMMVRIVCQTAAAAP